MIKNIFNILVICYSLTLLFGCTTTSNNRYTWLYKSLANNIDNEYFAASISPICYEYGCQAFNLKIRNKTMKKLKVNWNKTLYISDGKTSGGFMFKGKSYKDRNNTKLPDTIFRKSNFSKTIWPNNLVYFSNSWYHRTMGLGENGLFLSITANGQEVNEELLVNLYIINLSTGEKHFYGQFKEDRTGITFEFVGTGLKVTNVSKNSPAFSKIHIGDIIKEVNKEHVNTVGSFLVNMNRLKGKEVLFLISRNGKDIFVTVNPQ